MSRPTTTTTSATNLQNADIDAILDAFEQQQEDSGTARLADFLPLPAEPAYCRIAAELVRIDLERSWARGAAKRLEDYRAIVPLLFEDAQRLGEVAYEEYRLRRQAGENIEVSEYARKFSLDTSRWPACRDISDARASLPQTKSRGIHDATLRGTTFPKVGEQFAGFDLVEQLGRGAFGIVFRARQHDLAAREVVVKISAARSVEPQRLAKLQHTNIVPIYSVHRDARLLGICMPFLGRRSLADVLRPDDHAGADDQARVSTVAEGGVDTVAQPAAQSITGGNCKPVTEHQKLPAKPGPIAISTAIELIAQLAEGLAHAHSRGIVHSDLKPANVLLSDDGTPLLLDFNLSGDSSATQRTTLMVGGTLPYMAPEHLQAVLDGSPTLPASDIFSLGVIFFETLTGERPYQKQRGPFDEAAAAMILDRRRGAPSVRRLNSQISPAIASIVQRCLAPSIDGRYATARELSEDLRRHQDNLPLRHATEPSFKERGTKWLRRHARGARIAGLVVALAGLTAMSVLYTLRQEQVANLKAAANYRDFQSDALTASLNLLVPGTEPELHEIGQAAAERALRRFDSQDDTLSAANANFSRLSSAEQAIVEEQSSKLMYALAGSIADRQRAMSKRAMPPELKEFLQGVELLETGKYVLATKAWEGLVKQNPQDPARWFLLGNAYTGAGRRTDAEACYAAMIALQPKALNGYYYRGLSHFEQGRYADAEQDFSAVLELQPGLPTGLINRALVFLALGNYEQAEHDATAALQAGANDPRMLFVRARICEARGDAAGAQADRDRGFELPPIDDKGCVARGMALLRVDPQRASHEFEEGLKRFPKSPGLLQNLVHVYGDRLNQPEQALKYADRWNELRPDDPAPIASRAVLRARHGDRDAALADVERIAVVSAPPLTSLQLACVYSLTSKTESADADNALRRLQQALMQDPRLVARAATDPDLAPIRSKPEFESLLDAATQLTSPIVPRSVARVAAPVPATNESSQSE